MRALVIGVLLLVVVLVAAAVQLHWHGVTGWLVAAAGAVLLGLVWNSGGNR